MSIGEEKLEKEYEELIPFVNMFLPVYAFKQTWCYYDKKYGCLSLFYNEIDDVYMFIFDCIYEAPPERYEIIRAILQENGYRSEYDVDSDSIYIDYNERRFFFKPYLAKGFMIKSNNDEYILRVIDAIVNLYYYEWRYGQGFSDMGEQFVYFHSYKREYRDVYYRVRTTKVARLLMQYHKYIDYELIEDSKKRLSSYYPTKIKGHNIHVKTEDGKYVLIPIRYDYAIKIKECEEW